MRDPEPGPLEVRSTAPDFAPPLLVAEVVLSLERTGGNLPRHVLLGRLLLPLAGEQLGSAPVCWWWG